MKPATLGWLIGYFVALYPIYYNYDHTGFSGLISGIFGLIVAIVLEVWPND